MAREYTSTETSTYQAGLIPHDRVEEGTYILEVATTDLVVDVTRTALVRMRIE